MVVKRILEELLPLRIMWREEAWCIVIPWSCSSLPHQKRHVLEFTLVAHVEEVQVVECIDTPLVDHLLLKCKFILAVCVLKAARDKVWVDFHKPLKVARLAWVDHCRNVVVEFSKLGLVSHRLCIFDFSTQITSIVDDCGCAST